MHLETNCIRVKAENSGFKVILRAQFFFCNNSGKNRHIISFSLFCILSPFLDQGLEMYKNFHCSPHFSLQKTQVSPKSKRKAATFLSLIAYEIYIGIDLMK